MNDASRQNGHSEFEFLFVLGGVVIRSFRLFNILHGLFACKHIFICSQLNFTHRSVEWQQYLPAQHSLNIATHTGMIVLEVCPVCGHFSVDFLKTIVVAVVMRPQ